MAAACHQTLRVRSLLRQFGSTTMTQDWEIQSAYGRFSVCRTLFIRKQGPRIKRRPRCKSASNIPKAYPDAYKAMMALSQAVEKTGLAAPAHRLSRLSRVANKRLWRFAWTCIPKTYALAGKPSSAYTRSARGMEHRCRIKRSRARCNINRPCCSVDLICTKRTVGRRAASQIASASAASFLLRLT